MICILLIRQLMEQESLDAYNIQLEYMKNNMHLFSEEDVQVLQLTLQSNVAQNDNEQDRDSFAPEEDEEEESGGAEEDDNWSYEQLLSIGQALGGTVHFK